MAERLESVLVSVRARQQTNLPAAETLDGSAPRVQSSWLRAGLRLRVKQLLPPPLSLFIAHLDSCIVLILLFTHLRLLIEQIEAGTNSAGLRGLHEEVFRGVITLTV